MPRITALLHTKDDGLRLGRCLETLYPCDEIAIIDHDSRDSTLHVAREYGAHILSATDGVRPLQADSSVDWGWILALDPRESLSEGLAASLFEWKTESHVGNADQPCSVFLREETTDGWIEVPTAQTRLVPLSWNRWTGNFPIYDVDAVSLEGELLRFAFP